MGRFAVRFVLNGDVAYVFAMRQRKGTMELSRICIHRSDYSAVIHLRMEVVVDHSGQHPRSRCQKNESSNESIRISPPKNER